VLQGVGVEHHTGAYVEAVGQGVLRTEVVGPRVAVVLGEILVECIELVSGKVDIE